MGSRRLKKNRYIFTLPPQSAFAHIPLHCFYCRLFYPQYLDFELIHFRAKTNKQTWLCIPELRGNAAAGVLVRQEWKSCTIWKYNKCTSFQLHCLVKSALKTAGTRNTPWEAGCSCWHHIMSYYVILCGNVFFCLHPADWVQQICWFPLCCTLNVIRFSF